MNRLGGEIGRRPRVFGQCELIAVAERGGEPGTGRGGTEVPVQLSLGVVAAS